MYITLYYWTSILFNKKEHNSLDKHILFLLLQVIYYTFAILGMELFHDVIKYNTTSKDNR